MKTSVSPTPSKPVSAETAGPALARPEELRQRILKPYFPLLHDWLKHDLTSHEIPQSVELDGRSVALGGWEMLQFKRFRDAPAFGLKADSSLAMEGVAYQFSAGKLQQRFDSGPMPQPSDLPGFLDELVAQLSVGFALQILLQNSVDSLVQRGELREAKQLSDFRARIVQQVGALKDRVGSLELERAESDCVALVQAPVREMPDPGPMPESKARQLLEEQADAPPSWTSFSDEEAGAGEQLPPWLHEEAAKPTPAAPTSGATSARVKPMLIVLAVLIGIYAVVMFPRLAKEQSVQLSERDFARFDAVRIVRARPPSLYIGVDGALWDTASPGAKMEMVEAMGVVAEQAGYSGIHIRADNGRVVAEWLKSRGAAIRPVAKGDS